MTHTALSRTAALRHDKNVQLYKGLPKSTLAAVAIAVLVYTSLRPHTSEPNNWIWLVTVLGTYAIREFDYFLFARHANASLRTRHWSMRFHAGAVLSAIAWASTIWLLYPEGEPAYQVLLVMSMCAMAAGAIATLQYDKTLFIEWQTLILASVILKLIVNQSQLNTELALFCLFVYFYLLFSGRSISNNYHELLKIKMESENTSLTLIETTESMAKMGHWQWNNGSEFVELSNNMRLLIGMEKSTATVHECFSLIHEHDRDRVRQAYQNVLDTGEEVAFGFRIASVGTTNYRNMRQVLKRMNSSGKTRYMLGTVQDISDITSAEQKIYSMAYYDSLTNVANRTHFHDYLERYTSHCRNNSVNYALLYIDLDDFKSINDNLGHASGDIYLKQFANHLQRIVRRTDFIARLGGDEFCILLQDVKDKAEVLGIAGRCIEFTHSPLRINNHKIMANMSIGIAMYPADGTSSDDMIRAADMAMYHVKKMGKRNYAFFNSSMQDDVDQRVKFEVDIRQAIERNEFTLWYQPKVDMRTEKVSGVEALIRWQHPERGMVRPDLFIGAAERAGLIKDIGVWVMSEACSQLRKWNSMGFKPQMAVNISGDHFASEGFIECVLSTVGKFGVRAEHFEIEITESLSRDPDEHIKICTELRKAGIRVAIDDFGTGYSSLSVLDKLQVDTLKIDKSFIDGIPHDASSILMVKTVSELSHGLGYDLVAEGVETADQIAFLQTLYCPFVQGYYYSKPLPSDEMTSMLLRDASLPESVRTG